VSKDSDLHLLHLGLCRISSHRPRHMLPAALGSSGFSCPLKYRQTSRGGIRHGVPLTELSRNGMISLKLKQCFLLKCSPGKKEEQKK